jgi:aspartyl-tRNA(Asn)/glutamyl-tRNA(Gln) amidotransferase subunit A
MSKVLQRVQQCLERQAQYSGLNAFVTRANATQLQDAAKTVVDNHADGEKVCIGLGAIECIADG